MDIDGNDSSWRLLWVEAAVWTFGAAGLWCAVSCTRAFVRTWKR